MEELFRRIFVINKLIITLRITLSLSLFATNCGSLSSQSAGSALDLTCTHYAPHASTPVIIVTNKRSTCHPCIVGRD